MKSLNMMNRI